MCTSAVGSCTHSANRSLPKYAQSHEYQARKRRQQRDQQYLQQQQQRYRQQVTHSAMALSFTFPCSPCVCVAATAVLCWSSTVVQPAAFIGDAQARSV